MFEFVRTNKLLFLFAFISSACYLSFGYDLERNDFLKLSLLFAVLFFSTFKIIQHGKYQFWLVASFGILFRLLFLTSIPNLSQDFYRFIWDGRLLIQGINPYLTTPLSFVQSEVEIVPQMQLLYDGMGELNGSHFSNYPPINQLFFALGAMFSEKSILGSIIVLRFSILMADLGILYFGRKLLKQLNLDPHNIFWYFLNPFIIIELTGNLHFEAVMLFFLLWSLYLLHNRSWVASALIFGISISVKLIPLILVPIFYHYFVPKGVFSKGFWKLKKFVWLLIATVIITFLPFASSEFISNFVTTLGLWFQKFEFNASVYYIIRWIGYKTVGWNIIEIAGKILPLVVIGFILILSIFRKNKTTQQLITSMLFVISFYFLLATTVHPWYIATPVLLSIFTSYKFPILWSVLVMLSYASYTANGFSENLWLIAIEYVVLIGYAGWELFEHSTNSQKRFEHL